MDTPLEAEKKKPELIEDGILAEQSASGDDELLDEQAVPTGEKNLPVLPPATAPEAVEKADAYQELPESAIGGGEWEPYPLSPEEPAGNEAQLESGIVAPAEAVLLNASADGYTEDTSKQTSLGGLREEKFRKSVEEDEEVDVPKILHFEGIADPITPTTSPNPIVARFNQEFYCMEGWEMVEAAMRQGNQRILCRVKYITLPAGADLEIELSMLKAASRMGTQGPISYGERVANTTGLYKRLRACTANPLIYARGGARRKGEKGNTRTENVRWVIQSRLGQDQDTVTGQIRHGKHLTEEILGRLAAEGAKKRFFESIEKSKTQLVLKLQGIDAEPDEITAKVSEFVRQLFVAYKSKDGKFEKDTIKNLVAQFNSSDENETNSSTHQDLGGQSDLSTPKVEVDEESKSSENSDGKTQEKPKALSEFEKKKSAAVEVLAEFASEATAIVDDAGLKALALNVLARVCSQLLSHEDLQEAVEKLRLETGE